MKSFKLFFAESLTELEIRSETGGPKVEEDKNSWQLNYSASSGENYDKCNRISRRQLCRYIKEAVRARRIVYPDPKYFLNYYSYDGIRRREESLNETNTTLFGDSMIAYSPYRFVRSLWLGG